MRVESGTLPGGHRWRRCSSCGRPALTLEDGGRCRQSKDCKGKLHAQDALAKKGEGVCERQGCGNAARVTTAIGEGVCFRCLSEMAGP
jgi:hypothetical protein